MEFDDHEQLSSNAPVAPPSPGELEETPPPRRHRPLLWGMSLALVVIVVGAAVALVATGSHKKSAVVVLREASGLTTASGTARMSEIETLSIAGRTVTPVHIDGAADFTAKTGTVTLLDANGSTIETIRGSANVTYVSTPFVKLPGGAHWVSITPADAQVDPNAKSTVGSADPSSGLRFFSAIDGDPRVLDHDPLDGVDVTHYGFTVNMQSLFDQIGKGSTALGVPAMAAGLEQLKSLLDLTKLPAEAWIDGRGRVQRFALTIEVTKAGETVKAVTDLRFSHFGEPVSTAPPSASDTVPFRTVPHFFADLAQAAARQG